MNLRIPLAFVALALSAPALAQVSSSSTVTSSGSTTQQSTSVTNGVATTITGDTGSGTVSSAGIVVDANADRALLREVISALSADTSLRGAQIDVQVVGGRVTLNGITPGLAQAEAARSIAQSVAGSANVVSNLSISRQ
jgi:osmotically-inducible protein OsmY